MVNFIKAGDEISINKTLFKILGPAPDITTSANNQSIIIAVQLFEN